MKNYKYLRIAEHKAAVYLKLCSLDDFIRFIDYQQYKQVLLLPASEQSKEHFAVVHDGTMVMQETTGFKTLEDFQAAEKAGFPDAKTYYEGLAIGCTLYTDYEDAMKSGIQDLKIINKIRRAGFI
jgi:hypothetical protein